MKPIVRKGWKSAKSKSASLKATARTLIAFSTLFSLSLFLSFFFLLSLPLPLFALGEGNCKLSFYFSLSLVSLAFSFVHRLPFEPQRETHCAATSEAIFQLAK